MLVLLSGIEFLSSNTQDFIEVKRSVRRRLRTA